MSGIQNLVCALNQLKRVDKAFFIICAVIIVLIVAVYFLIPVFNKKLYKEQRDNLKKREAAFKSNLQGSQPSEPEEAQEEQQADTEIAEVSEEVPQSEEASKEE
ncbi:MAG: hypothetical protein K2N84_00810 [Clostridia bacterium]|nr:hypothetical protein [Clostridia bacterium]